jgi:Ca2+-binding EF-hand superfamily protein
MIENVFSRKNLIAWTLVAGVAFAGCANGDERMGDDPEVQPGQVEPGYETQEQAQRMRATPPLSELDADGDGRVTQQEFQTYARQQAVFDRWDEDRDGSLGRGEFDAIGFDRETGDFAAWDEDGDGSLDADEFFRSFFRSFDDNEDGHWDDGDWDDAGDSGLFDV